MAMKPALLSRTSARESTRCPSLELGFRTEMAVCDAVLSPNRANQTTIRQSEVARQSSRRFSSCVQLHPRRVPVRVVLELLPVRDHDPAVHHFLFAGSSTSSTSVSSFSVRYSPVSSYSSTASRSARRGRRTRSRHRPGRRDGSISWSSSSNAIPNATSGAKSTIAFFDARAHSIRPGCVVHGGPCLHQTGFRGLLERERRFADDPAVARHDPRCARLIRRVDTEHAVAGTDRERAQQLRADVQPAFDHRELGGGHRCQAELRRVVQAQSALLRLSRSRCCRRSPTRRATSRGARARPVSSGRVSPAGSRSSRCSFHRDAPRRLDRRFRQLDRRGVVGVRGGELFQDELVGLVRRPSRRQPRSRAPQANPASRSSSMSSSAS